MHPFKSCFANTNDEIFWIKSTNSEICEPYRESTSEMRKYRMDGDILRDSRSPHRRIDLANLYSFQSQPISPHGCINIIKRVYTRILSPGQKEIDRPRWFVWANGSWSGMKGFCFRVSLKLFDLCHDAVEVHGLFFVSNVCFFSTDSQLREKLGIRDEHISAVTFVIFFLSIIRNWFLATLYLCKKVQEVWFRNLTENQQKYLTEILQVIFECSFFSKFAIIFGF